MKNVTGPPVQGEDFFGRKSELEFVWEKIEDGNNIILPSPRRVGKTSFAKKLLKEAIKRDWDTMELNLEGVRSEADFMVAFSEQLRKMSWWESTKDKGVRLIEKLKPSQITAAYGDATFAFEWEKTKAELYQDISALMDHKSNTLIFFDEVAVLLKLLLNGERGETAALHFLHWLRDLRQVTDSKIRWIYCSSIGIENIAHQHGMSDAINDFYAYKLVAFNTETSLKFIQALEMGSKTKLNGDIREQMVVKLDYCLPFFIQILFAKIDVAVRVENMPVDDKLVDKAYNALLGEVHFNTWEERLNEQYSDSGKDAKTLLAHLAKEKTGSKRSVLFNQLNKHYQNNEQAEEALNTWLYMLENDGYLIQEGELYRFRSPLLRDFWYKRFVI